MAQTTNYNIYYPDTDQAGYQEIADVPENDRLQAESIDAALALIDLRDIVGDLENLETEVTSSIVAAINSLKLGTDSSIGDLENLETIVKTSVVDAINEVKTKTDDIGSLSSLQTIIKTSIVAAINEIVSSTYTKSETNTLLDGKLDTSLKGANNGLAELDSNGKVPSNQLPSYVDDVIEGYYYNNKFYEESTHTTEITPESNKIYVDLETNKTYRWGGTAYTEISESLALGETESTAYRGDKGKETFDRAVQNEKDINEIEEILYRKIDVESTENKVELPGNPELEIALKRLNGATEQESTNGYQLYQPFSYSRTASGVTFEYTLNGEIKANGTATSNATSMLSSASTPYQITLPAGTYNISGATTIVRIQVVNSAGTAVGETTSTDTSANFTLEETTNVFIRAYIISGNTADNVVIKPMLESGSTAHEWEPYTNGASPNPDYPQEIKSVTGEQEVVVRGKNRIKVLGMGPNSETIINAHGLEIVLNSDGTMTINGTTDGSGNIYITLNTNLGERKGGGTFGLYALSGTSQVAVTWAIYETGTSNGKNTNTASPNTMALDGTITYTTTRIAILCSTNVVTFSNLKLGFMLLDDKIATTKENKPYEPYYKITKQLSLGDKELFEDSFISKENDNWYFNDNYSRYTGKLTYNSFNTTINRILGRFSIDSWQQAIAGGGIAYCDKANNVTGSVDASKPNASFTVRPKDTGLNNVNMWYDDITTAELAQTFLSNTNFDIVYQLAQIHKTQITDTTLINQLEDLQKIQQLNGTTIVEIEGEDINPTFILRVETDSITALDTQKVGFTDYATSSIGGVIKVSTYRGTEMSSGILQATEKTYEQYQNTSSTSNNAIISKGTLENVLNARIGDINSLLDEINREVV